MLTYNSKSAVTVTMKNDREYLIRQYNLESYCVTFEEKVGGLEQSYIKLKEVEQNATGEKFACVYLDDGVFYIRTFGETSRSEDEIKEEQFNINEEFGLNKHTMPINNFPDPFGACCFITDDYLYVNIFHNASLKHIHFFYNTKTREVTRKYETTL